MNEDHYPNVDTDSGKKQQAAQATAQSFGTLRGRLGVFFAHILLLVSPVLAYMEFTTPTPECTASEMVCAFSPGSLGLPLIVIMASFSAFAVVIYWRYKFK